jgi:hypothetical protein
VAASGNSLTLSGVTPLPPGLSLAAISGLTGWLVGRHPALRTTYRERADRPPLQVCHAEGDLDVEVIDADGRDPDAVAEEVRARYQATPFRLAGEWPLRTAVVLAGGAPVRQVAAYAHLAVDAGGLAALLADLTARDPATGAAPPPAGRPPLEQARLQREPAALRHQARSLRYAERLLRAAPPHPLGPAADRPAEHLEVRYRSSVLPLAARLAAARTGAGTAAVLLAAYALAQARVTGVDPVLAAVVAHNRFRPELAGSVSTVAQLTPVLVRAGGGSLGDAVRRASAAALGAYKNGYFDPYGLDALAAGIGTERICFVNDRRTATGPVPTAAEVRAAPQSTVDWPDDPQRPRHGLYLHFSDAPDAIELSLTLDLRHPVPGGPLRLAREIEAVAVATALDPAAAAT